MKILNKSYLHSYALLQFCLKLGKAACHPTKCDVINDIKLFPTVCRRKFLTLSNQKCIRIAKSERKH